MVKFICTIFHLVGAHCIAQILSAGSFFSNTGTNILSSAPPGTPRPPSLPHPVSELWTIGFTMTAPFDYELKRQLAKQSDQISNILDTLINHNVEGAREAKEHLSHTPKSLRDKTINHLDELWSNYLHPFCKLEEYHSLVQRFRKDEQNKADSKELTRARCQYQDDLQRDLPRVITLAANEASPAGASFLMQPSVAETAVVPYLSAETSGFELTKYVVYKDKQTKALNPCTQELFTRPLEFIHSVSLADFQDAIVKFALTDIINVNQSLQNILERCQTFGFSKEQAARLLHFFINENFPQFSFVIENTSSPREVWTQILSLVRIEDVASSATEKLASFVRHPGTNIETAFLKFKTLLRLKIQHSEPHASMETVDRKSDTQARMALPELVNDALREHFVTWLKERKRDGEHLETSDILDYLHSLEITDERFRLTQDRHPAHRISVENIGMFHSDMSAHMTRASVAKSGDSLTPMRDHPEKPGPSTPQPPPRPGKAVNSPGWRPPRGGKGRGGRGRGRGRGRGTPAPQAGEHQPAPGRHQSRPQGPRERRGRSRSRDRSSSRGPGRPSAPPQTDEGKSNKDICLKCLHQHKPPCRIYIKQAPTLCRVCSAGYHFPKACRLNPKNV